MWEKILAERLYKRLEKRGIRIHTFRFGNVYGPGQRHVPQYPHLIPHFYDQNKDKEQTEFTIFGDGTQKRAWIHVRDIVEGVLAASLSKKPGSTVYNLGGTRESNAHTIEEIV